jgi:hypothetical protein
VQDRGPLADEPVTIVAGVAAKAAIVGGGGSGLPVTATVRVTLPLALVALRV